MKRIRYGEPENPLEQEGAVFAISRPRKNYIAGGGVRKIFNCKKACIEQLEREGFYAHDAERRNKFGTLDWDGWADVIAWRLMKLSPKDQDLLASMGVRLSPVEWLGIQVTTRPHLQEHLDKLSANPRITYRWRDLGLKAQIWVYPSKDEREEGETEPDRLDYRGEGLVQLNQAEPTRAATPEDAR